MAGGVGFSASRLAQAFGLGSGAAASAKAERLLYTVALTILSAGLACYAIVLAAEFDSLLYSNSVIGIFFAEGVYLIPFILFAAAVRVIGGSVLKRTEHYKREL